MDNRFLNIANGTSAPYAAVPVLDFAAFRSAVSAALKRNCRVELFTAVPEDESGENFSLLILLGDPAAHELLLCRTSAVSGSFASFTAEFPAFNRFEREIHENTGLFPQGHPWLKPLRFKNSDPGVTDHFAMSGEAVHEVAVGPVHAGVIEPGHFRFECMGEDVYSLEISLGYQHRGVENMLVGGPDARSSILVETAAGDTSIAAALNYSRIIEALSGIKPDENAQLVRQFALELERCANHIGDLGALAGDVAFLPTASFCGRIRGEYLNMSAELCGNRFGRNFVVPGGVRFATDARVWEKIIPWLYKVSGELDEALTLMFDSPTVLDRFENTGTVTLKNAAALGLVGVAARASGMKCDARTDFPVSGEKTAEPVDFAGSGDVLSRAMVRLLELRRSHRFLFKVLEEFRPECAASARVTPALAPEQIAVSVTEAWRGELCHLAITGADGKFRLCKIVDPSFHNWEALAMALRGEQISHFPICNKSFNLSYCGHDL